MPELDGFELTKQVKTNDESQHVPVILVTSLESSEDKAQGLAVGADASIVKNDFDQRNLLDTIVQLV